MPRWYKLNGKEVEYAGSVTEDGMEKMKDYFEWFEQIEKRIIKRTFIEYGNEDILVSTLFLGLDNNISGKGKPILFETKVFPHAIYIEQYITYDASLKNHNRLVEIIKGYEKASIPFKDIEKLLNGGE